MLNQELFVNNDVSLDETSQPLPKAWVHTPSQESSCGLWVVVDDVLTDLYRN